MRSTSNGFTPEDNNDYFTVISEYNTEYDFVIARLNTLIVLIHQAEQELSSKDQASKDQASKDQASKDQASKDQARATPAASIDAPCSSTDKLNRLREDAYQLLGKYTADFFDSDEYPGTLEQPQKESLINKRNELDGAISQEFSPHRSKVSIGAGTYGDAYILLHPHYKANIRSLIKYLKNTDLIKYLKKPRATNNPVHNLTKKLGEIKSNLENIRLLKYSQDQSESGACSAKTKVAAEEVEEERLRKLKQKAKEREGLASMADKHLELIREWKTIFKEYLKNLDAKNDLGVDEIKRLQATKEKLHRLNAPIVRSDPNNPASSLLSVEKINYTKEKPCRPINLELSIYKGTSLDKKRALGNEQGQASDTHSRPRYCLYKSMANAAMDVANFHAKYCRPHQDIKLENQADDGLFDEMSRDRSINTPDGSPVYLHPYMLKLLSILHKLGHKKMTVSADLPQNRLSTVVDARALGISFIRKILPDFDDKLVPGKFYAGSNSHNKERYLLLKPSTEKNKDFLDTTNIIEATRIKLEKLYDNKKLKACGANSPARLARIVSTFIGRMITVKPKIFGCIPDAGDCDNSFISAAMQHCKHVPTDIEQVQFFSLLHRLMDLAQSHGSVQSKDEINIDRDINEIITRLRSLAEPSKAEPSKAEPSMYVLTATSDGDVEISLRDPNEDQQVVADIPDSCNDKRQRELFKRSYQEEVCSKREKPTTYIYLARSDRSVVMSQVEPDGYSEKDIVTIEDSDIDTIHDGNILLQLREKSDQFRKNQKEINTLATKEQSGSEKSGTALRDLFAKQHNHITADKQDRPSCQYAIIKPGKRDAVKKLFESSIAQGHPAPEIQLFVDPDLSNELTRYQDSIEKSHKNRIDRGSAVDELYQVEEGLRPPAAMRERLQEYYFKTLIDGGSTVNELYKGEEDSRPPAAIRPLLQEYYFKTFFEKISNHDDNSRTNELPMHVQKYCAAVCLMHKLTNPLATQSQCAETISQVYPKAKSRWASRFKYLYNDVERCLNNDVESSSNSELLKARLVEYTSKLERDNKSVRNHIRDTFSTQLSSGSSLFSPVHQSTAIEREDSVSPSHSSLGSGLA